VRYPHDFRDATKLEPIAIRYFLELFDAANICGQITLGMGSEDPLRKRVLLVKLVDEIVIFLHQLGQFPNAVDVHPGVTIALVVAEQGLALSKRSVILTPNMDRYTQYPFCL
jgi:hypothetical protein